MRTGMLGSHERDVYNLGNEVDGVMACRTNGNDSNGGVTSAST